MLHIYYAYVGVLFFVRARLCMFCVCFKATVCVCVRLLSGGLHCVSRRARLPLDLSSIDKPIRAGDASGSPLAPLRLTLPPSAALRG